MTPLFRPRLSSSPCAPAVSPGSSYYRLSPAPSFAALMNPDQHATSTHPASPSHDSPDIVFVQQSTRSSRQSRSDARAHDADARPSAKATKAERKRLRKEQRERERQEEKAILISAHRSLASLSSDMHSIQSLVDRMSEKMEAREAKKRVKKKRKLQAEQQESGASSSYTTQTLHPDHSKKKRKSNPGSPCHIESSQSTSTHSDDVQVSQTLHKKSCPIYNDLYWTALGVGFAKSLGYQHPNLGNSFAGIPPAIQEREAAQAPARQNAICCNAIAT